MRALKFYLRVFISLCIVSHVYASQNNMLQEYNNIISQHILKNTRDNFFTSQDDKKITFNLDQQVSSSKSIVIDIDTTIKKVEWRPGAICMEYFGETFTIKEGNYQRSFRINGDYEVRRAWFYNCQSIGILLADTTGKLITQDYRVCHMADMEQLNPEQLALFAHATAILQGNRTPVIHRHDDYQTYLTLPEDLQKVFTVCPHLLPKWMPILPEKKRALTVATLATMLLGGYMTIF